MLVAATQAVGLRARSGLMDMEFVGVVAFLEAAEEAVSLEMAA